MRLTLMPTGEAAPTDAEIHILEDQLWAHATPANGLEHLRARAVPPGIGIVLYIRAVTTGAAHAKARHLVTTALAATGNRYTLAPPHDGPAQTAPRE
ncbi:hypothetical protein [Streptomyces sp. CB03911]|uniref:hypothetical protein n=1 Tax=Streptomyces sp. CB03911 TaxID=1804758 RepID=UPI0018FE75C8|nr:hypothetical protein [Streptomyces sp. CB03911]